MNPWLKAKQLGLPRWAWVSLFSGAVLIGLYMRTRGDEEEYGPEEEPADYPTEGELEYYEGTDLAGGLAAAGLVGPAQGQVVPVEAPFIPDGFVDVFAAQAETTQQLIGALSEREPGERVETIREVEPIGEPQRTGAITGGGAPKKKPHHKTPKKPKGKKPKKPKPKAKGKKPAKKPKRKFKKPKGKKGKK